MNIKSTLLRPYTHYIANEIAAWKADAVNRQNAVFRSIINQAKNTVFGLEHDFKNIQTYQEFTASVPLRDYEALKPYIERIKHGEMSVLWPGKPAYFAKTSGTTSGVKYIPLSKESLPNHFGSARNALFNYAKLSGNYDWLDRRVIFLSGSPELETIANIPTGRLSGIVNHQVPNWLKSNQLPSFATNCLPDWETKLNAIVGETKAADMSLISGIPPWVQMYYERLLHVTGKQFVKDIFPNLSVFVYGGVNFEPYRPQLEALVGKSLTSIETYPASEGFIAFQDTPEHQGLLLNADSGIFFEFVPANELFDQAPTRLSLGQVEMGINYALIINNNAGLWGYNIGDTVEFVSLNPYRIRVTGRVKHFISAFGEHVIGKEVEDALLTVANKQAVRIVEFTVAPQITPPEGGQPYHEWFVEFDELPQNIEQFALQVNEALMQHNIYYDDLIRGNILRTLIIRPLRRDAFREYMKSQGKLGGQNKVPRLANDRILANQLAKYLRL
jgi:acyl-CoA synthetase (AMP-forming)/AMP-acid ligase II